jgi:hypothetical protein
MCQIEKIGEKEKKDWVLSEKRKLCWDWRRTKLRWMHKKLV